MASVSLVPVVFELSKEAEVKGNPIKYITHRALLLRARADFSLFLENFKRGRVSARARVIDIHYSLSCVHVSAILSKDPSSGG